MVPFDGKPVYRASTVTLPVEDSARKEVMVEVLKVAETLPVEATRLADPILGALAAKKSMLPVLVVAFRLVTLTPPITT